MTDIFGYNKQGTIGKIATPSNTLVSITGGSVTGTILLAQSCNITYQRSVQPVYELGSDYVWMAMGQSSGTWQITRAVGERGDGKTSGVSLLLVPYQQDDQCSAQTLFMQGNSDHCGINPGSIIGTGAILTQVGANTAVGQLVVTDNANWNISALATDN